VDESGEKPAITREQLAEEGISATDAEVAVVNAYIANDRRQKRGEKLQAWFVPANVDEDRVRMLVSYVRAKEGGGLDG